MKIEDMEGISEPLLERDIQSFIRGRARLYAIKRWIMTRSDATEKEVIAEYIAERVKDFLLDQNREKL